MELWLLRPATSLSKCNPWEPWYDKCFGFVVRADTEEQARVIANGNSGGEAYGVDPSPWLDSGLSTCESLTSAGEPGIIITDFHAA